MKTRKTVLVLAFMALAMLVANGVAWAAVQKGTNRADTQYGYGGNDKLYGRGRGDQQYGHRGADTLYGSTGSDLQDGGDGNDTHRGEAGPDELHGGDGGDRLRGGEGNDYMSGGDGNDNLRGGGNADTLAGNAGDNTLNSADGIAGNDTLHGAPQDTCTFDVDRKGTADTTDDVADEVYGCAIKDPVFLNRP